MIVVVVSDCNGYIHAGTDVCPDICGSLPEKQRQAAGLAVSMVALTSCEGDIEGAARAVSTAAADGDLTAFGAGLSVGAAVLAGGHNRQHTCSCNPSRPQEQDAACHHMQSKIFLASHPVHTVSLCAFLLLMSRR